MMTILIHEYVTGGGLAGQPLPKSLATEGRAMRRALVREFRQVEGARVVETLDERFADEAEGAILVGPGRELEVLTQEARRSDFTLVIAPETDGVLEERARRVERAGRSLGSSPAAVALTGDKLAFAEHLRGHAIATPRTALHPAEGFAPPFVLKPRDGAGAEETVRVDRVEQRPSAGTFRSARIIQDHVPGEPMSASFLVGGEGETILWGVGWQEVAIERGGFVYQGGRLPAPDSHATDDVLRAVRSVEGLRGWVGVDFVRDLETGACVVLEVNPRPTTSVVGWLARGRPGELARAWLKVVAGVDIHGKDHDLPPRSEGLTRFFPDGTIEASQP